MKVVLFDMDGTLTPARQKIDSSVVNSLIELQTAGWVVGIVSGSDMDYIVEQCDLLFDVNSFDFKEALWFPCNGTKRYKFSDSSKQICVYENSIKDKIGHDQYNQLIRQIFDSQIAMRYMIDAKHIPLSGTFIQYRGSTINWCPIGRDASIEERKKWIVLDQKHNIRQSLLSRLKCSPYFEGIDVRLGGETSFDIFPTGWDKTYALTNFAEYTDVWFVGDRCQLHGNDRELYEAIKHRMNGESFETTGPSKTIDIIRNNILNHSRQKEDNKNE